MPNELTPERKTELIREIAEQDAERLHDSLHAIFEEGMAIFGKPKPLARLRGYLAATLAQDVPLVLDPDYPDKLRQKQVPPLLALQLRDQQSQIAAQGGDITTVTNPPSFWLRLLEMPTFDGDGPWAWHSRDFAHVLKQQGSRELEAQP